MNDNQLLREFAETESEPAFRALVERRLPLVFGTARRITRNETLAEEVAQTVFLLLARKAGSVARETILSGWLYRTTRFVALQALRSEQRRLERETRAVTMMPDDRADAAWERVAPELDAALSSLKDSDRQALLLRFFDGESIAAIGRTIGVSEEAAKKRVSRALERLRAILVRKGVGVSAAALAAGLGNEASAAVPLGLATRIQARIPAEASAGAGVASAWLLQKALRAIFWMRLKIASAFVAGTAAAVLLFAQLKEGSNGPSLTENPSRPQAQAGEATPKQTAKNAETKPGFVEINGVRSRVKALRIVVLDAAGQPIAGASVVHSLGAMKSLPGAEGMITDQDGVAVFQVPEELPGTEDITQFQAFITAPGFAQRTIMWLSSIGGALRTVGPEYVVHLEEGIRIGGKIVDESGKGIEGGSLGFLGNNYSGYSTTFGEDGRRSSKPVVRAEDYASFYAGFERPDQSPAITDKDGRFTIEHYPSDLKALMLSVNLPDGSLYKFKTEEGMRLTSENLPPISFDLLKAQTASIHLKRGVDVNGIALDETGNPVRGATITESVMNGNLRVLSRNETDEAGEFHLSNRQPREVILAASADGFGSISKLVTISNKMAQLRLILPRETPIFGRVVEAKGLPVASAAIGIVDYMNDGIGVEWSGASEGDGRFVWRGAPTNELWLQFRADGFAPRLAKVRPAADEQLITLQPGNRTTLRLAVNARDAATGDPLKSFQVKVRTIESRDGVPSHVRKTREGINGRFEIELDLKEIELEQDACIALSVEADGYEAALTEKTYVMEGDREFDVKLVRGGIIEGDLIGADGQPAARAQVVITQKKTPAFIDGHDKVRGNIQTESDAAGHFRIQKSLNAVWCVVSHESGWATERIEAGAPAMRIQLKPWASVEVMVDPSVSLPSESSVSVQGRPEMLDYPLHIGAFRSLKGMGRIEFARLPAGKFSVGLVPMSFRDAPIISTLQTNIVLAPGERRTILLKTEGTPVRARLKFPKGAGISRERVITTLTLDVPMPKARGPEFFASSESLDEGARAYNLAYFDAIGRDLKYLAETSEDGNVAFAAVPPGRYIFESKHYGKSGRDSMGDDADANFATRAMVEVRAQPDEPVWLGEFALEPK